MKIYQKKKSKFKANHALVMMWQSLGENMVQLITRFASHGPIKGSIIAMINNNTVQF